MQSSSSSKRRDPRGRLLIAAVCVFGCWCAASVAAGYELSHGRQVLLNHGLQIPSLAYPHPAVPLNSDVFRATNFTTAFLTHPDASVAKRLAPLWARDAIYDPATHDLVPACRYLSDDELQISDRLVGLTFGDEVEDVLTNPTVMPNMAATFAEWNRLYPNTLAYTNQYGRFFTETQLRDFMRTTRPDMLSFDTYPGDFDNTKELWFGDMQTYRNVALEGYDGKGTSPIPYAQYLKLYRREGEPLHSESFVRVQQFTSWAFGYTFANGFLYNWNPPGVTTTGGPLPEIFSDVGDSSPITPVFGYVAETNRQSRNLGPALVRLVSTDIRMIRGRGNGVRNASIPGVSSLTSWTAPQGGDPYITAITPLGADKDHPSTTNYSDVWIGHFQPLLESNPGCTFVDGLHFMIVNGRGASENEWYDAPGTTAESLGEWYRLAFNFAGSDFDSLVRLSRDTGQVELVPLVPLGSSRYSLDLYLEGGTGDLFGFWNSSNPLPTIPEPGTLSLLGLAMLGVAPYAFRNRR